MKPGLAQQIGASVRCWGQTELWRSWAETELIPALVSPKQTQGTGRGGEGMPLHEAKHPKCTCQRLGAQPWHQWMRICSLGISATQLGEALGDYNTDFVANIIYYQN